MPRPKSEREAWEEELKELTALIAEPQRELEATRRRQSSARQHSALLGRFPPDGEDCDAWEEVIRAEDLLMEGISTLTNQGLQLHVECFYLWDEERDVSGRLDNVRRPKPS